MPLRDDLLNPIPGDNPCGQNLYYAPLFDKLKEARREEEDIAQGEWQRARKVADWPLVIKLAGEALAKQTKDLQIAAWLAEAHLTKEGISVFPGCLILFRELVDTFWDNIYPELEDGDAEMRATPLDWVGNSFDRIVRRLPVTKSGLDSFKYKEALATGYEADASTTEKSEARAAAIAEGKLTAEEFDKAFEATSADMYAQWIAGFDASLEALDNLQSTCEQRFGDVAPGFSKLRAALEEVRQTIHILLNRKRADNPEVHEEPAHEEEAEQPVEESSSYAEESAPQPVRRAAPKVKRPIGAEPADKDDAADRVSALARYLRREDPYSPAAYMMVRGLRFGELRAAGESPGYELLTAPSTEVRQELKRLANEGMWQEVLEAAENAASEPCGRAWLDVHRYTVRACSELGYYYDPIANAVRGMVRGLLTDYPQFLDWTLADDTPTANAETVNWLREQVLPPPASGSGSAPEPEQIQYSYHPPTPPVEQQSGVIDAWQLAIEQMQSGNKREAVEILSREAAQEHCGRGRFLRKVQLARLCLDCQFEPIARPILEALAEEIDSRKLEFWEPGDTLAQSLALLYSCFSKSERESDAGRALYARICRLDPVQAMAVSR